MISSTMRHMPVFATAVILAAALAWGGPAVAQGTLFVEGDNVGIGTPTPTSPLEIVGGTGATKILVRETNSTAAVRTMFELVNNGSVLFRMRSTQPGGSNWAFSLGSSGFGISNAFTSGIEMLVRNTGDLIIKGSLQEGSSRDVKENFLSVAPEEILAKVSRLPITSWNYKATSDSEKHIGPVAEDFYAEFALGRDPEHIAPRDLAGVALVAIQALASENSDLKAANQRLESRLDELEAMVQSLLLETESAARPSVAAKR